LRKKDSPWRRGSREREGWRYLGGGVVVVRASVTQERGKARGGGGAMEKWSWGSEERERLVMGVIRSFDRGSRAWWRSSFSEKVLVELHFTRYYFAGVKKKEYSISFLEPPKLRYTALSFETSERISVIFLRYYQPG
jgi:hypothetical protein